MGKLLALVACGTLALGAAACGSGDEDGGGGGGGSSLKGKIAIDGSSTVFPFAQAAAEQFQAENPGVRVAVGESGTGGGFEKFCAGETDISDASRPIKDDEEVPLCKKNGVAYKEIQVANDGIAVVTNKSLKIECMITNQLEALWSTSKAKRYNEVNPEFPSRKVSLFGPGTDSGTFDFFTEKINGGEGKTRKDYQPSEDDNVLVQGVAGDEGGLGYFGFSYYEQNKDKLNVVAIDAGEGDGCIEPTTRSIQSGEYKPLSRPIFMYPSEKSLRKPEVKAFMDYVVANYDAIAKSSQIVPMTKQQASMGKQALEG